MIITNRYELPEPLVKAITYDLTKQEGFSVTSLIQPPRITQLLRRHWDEIVVDASERIWVLLGQAIHYILKIYYTEGAIQEQYIEVMVEGEKVVMRPDLWLNGVLDDYKVTSTWSVVFEPQGREDWHKQLNIYRWGLYVTYKLESDKIRNISIFRDWQQSKANDEDYPSISIAVIEAPVWTYEQTEQYVKERIRLHKVAAKLPDDKLPFCSSEEMWTKPTTYAIMKAGRIKALKVCQTLEEAERYAKPGEYIVTREGKRTRCEGYCDVSKFCSQFKEYKEGKDGHISGARGHSNGNGVRFA